MKTLIITLLILTFSFTAFGQAARAIVYVYSYAAGTTLGTVKKPIFLDDKEIAEIRPAKFFIAQIEAGKHTFRLKNKKFGGIEMNFEPGETYYIRMNWQSDGKLMPAGLALIGKESGAYDIKQLKPVDKKNIKDSSIVVTELKEN
jgi:hypothetical protein